MGEVLQRLIKCFAMIKDEVDIVEDWLRHTLDLFGSGNVYVLDNESTDGTESILRHYRPHVWSESVKASVEGPSKGQLITSLMHEHKDECDILVPIDGDEFIGLQNSWDRDAIIAEFERLDLRQYGRFKFPLNYDAIAAADEDNFPVRSLNNFSVTSYEFFGDTYKDFAKVFYSAEPFIRSDNGNHFGESSQPSVQYTSLWLYHYSLRSLRQFEKKILNAAAYTNYWKTHRYSRHWKAAYEAYLEGRFREHYETQLGRLRQQRRMTWPAARLRALDLDPRLPARVGPLEPIADRVPD